MKEFIYTRDINIAQLQDEILGSSITIAVQSISSSNNDVTITFKADLSVQEESILDSIIENHVPQDEETADVVKLGSTEDNYGTPIVYATSKPLDHYVCFQGASDSVDEIGGGNKITFHLSSKTEKQTKEFTFNEDVYIKDGYMITKNAPLGACIDIEIIHPLYNIVVMAFGKKIPIFGSGWFPLDTEDRGFLPKGMIVRITIWNSNGTDENLDEEYPANFYVSGRFELYRPKP
jgi:hypothetical protein